MAEPARSRGTGRQAWPALWPAAGAAAILLLAYLAHPAVQGFRFPVGPDGPVYTWLARLAGSVGFVDAPGAGAGGPALSLLLGSILRTDPLETVTVLGPLLATITGLAAGALVEAGLGHDRLRTAAAVLLAGAFAAYLAGGWLANLALVAMLLVAMAVLVGPSRGAHGVVVAAASLAAAGLTHRIFILVGAAVLLVAAGWLWLGPRGRAEGGRRAAVRLATAATGGASLGLLAGAWIATGPSIPGDTSQDGFFRRVGLRALLLDRYRERFLGEAARSALPLAAGVGLSGRWAASPPRGTGEAVLRVVLAAWAALTAGGVLVLGITGWGPPYRLVQFGFFLPVAAAAGAAVLGRRSLAASAIAVAATVGFAGAAMFGWFRQAPSFSPDDLGAAGRGGAAVASLPPGTPIVFVVDTDQGAAAYHVSQAANVLRMAVPPERIPDVHLAVGLPGNVLARRATVTGDAEHDRVSQVYLRDVQPILGDAAILVLARFNPEGYQDALTRGVVLGEGVVALTRAEELSSPAATGPPPGVGAGTVLWLAVAALGALGALGWGWARWAMPDAATALVVLASPALGTAVAILPTIAGDRVGLLPGGGGALALVLAVAGAGLILGLRARR